MGSLRLMDKACEICGSNDNPDLISNCTQCKRTHEHWYCMPKLLFDPPNFNPPAVWYCDECRQKANGRRKNALTQRNSMEGQKTEIQRSLHTHDLTKERKTSTPDPTYRNGVHPICCKPSKKFESAKVKYISSEEVTILSKVKPFGRKCFAVRCQYNQVSVASPPIIKQPSTIKCTSPSRKENCDAQVRHLKRSAAASQDPSNTAEINTKLKARSVTWKKNLIEEPATTTREVPSTCTGATTNKRKYDSHLQIHDQPREKRASDASDIAIGCESETKSWALQEMNMPVTLVINPSEEHAKRPAPPICWTGSFHVFDGANHHLGEFSAYFPSKVSHKVYEISKKMPENLKLEMLPRMDDWPKMFETDPPVFADIGLYFFSNELERYEDQHSRLLELSCSFVMRTYIDNIKLLIYSSEVFPADSQRIDGETYLWGIFVKQKEKCTRRPGQSTTSVRTKVKAVDMEAKHSVREPGPSKKPVRQSSGFAHKTPPGFTMSRKYTH